MKVGSIRSIIFLF